MDRDVDSVKGNTFLREVSFDKQDCRYQVGLPWKAESLPHSPALTRLLRVTALVLRFIKKLKGQKTYGDCLQICASDAKEAEMLWIKEVQMTSFPGVNRLLGKPRVHNQLINQLNLFRENNGLKRCEGRLEHLSWSIEANNPIRLPYFRHSFTDLIIRNRHHEAHHCGTNGKLICVYFLDFTETRIREACPKEVCNLQTTGRKNLFFNEISTITTQQSKRGAALYKQRIGFCRSTLD